MTSPTEHLLNLIEGYKAEDFAAEYAFHLAVGTYADSDDPDEALCVVVVSEAKLFSITLADGYAAEKDGEFVSFLINAVILNAFMAWKQDFERLKAVATERLKTEGPAIREAMDREILEAGW